MFTISERGEIAVLELAHGKANAMDLELCRELSSHLEHLGQEARPILLTGRGAAFSAGVDLIRVLEGGPSYTQVFLPALEEALERLFFYPAPVVAAVNGHAVAGGCLLACAADYRIMAQGKGRIGLPELLVGVPLPAIGIECARSSVSPCYLQRVVYRGETFLPDEALAAGLVDELASPDELLTRALAQAQALAATPRHVFAMTKQQLRRPAAERLRQAAGDYGREVSALWIRPDSLENIRAYVARVLAKGESKAG